MLDQEIKKLLTTIDNFIRKKVEEICHKADIKDMAEINEIVELFKNLKFTQLKMKAEIYYQDDFMKRMNELKKLLESEGFFLK